MGSTANISFEREVRRVTVTVQGTPGTPPAVNLPLSKVGYPVPAIIGMERVFQPNVIWYGNLQPIVEITRTSETVEEKVRVPSTPGTVVYETVQKTIITEVRNIVGYTVDMQLGLCLGPGVHLHEIFVDNELVWSGNVGPLRTAFTVTSDTFINGECVFSGGNFDQAPDPYLADFVTDLPGYVGVAHIIIKGVKADAGLGQLSFTVSRYPNPLGLAAGVNKIGDDVNLASVVAEVISNDWGFGGVPIGDVDSTTFTSAANALFNEGNAASIILQQQSSASTVIGILQDQALSTVYQNPATSKVEIKLLRQTGINLGALPIFDESNIVSLQAFSKEFWQEVKGQLQGSFTNREKGYETDSVFMQNIGLLSSEDTVKRAAEADYPACMVKDLAVDLTARDLARLSVPLFKGTMLTDRSGATLLPGSMFLLNQPKLKLFSVPCWVNKVRKSPINQNNVVVTFEQLVGPDADALFAAPSDPVEEVVDTSAKVPTAVSVITAPYWAARKRSRPVSYTQENSSIWPLILATPNNSVQSSFEVWANPHTGSVYYYRYTPPYRADLEGLIDQNGANYPTKATTQAAIGQYENIADGIIPSLVISNVVNVANLDNIGIDGVRNGILLLLIDDEILSFEAVNSLGGGSYELVNVHRGLLDTAPQAHALGATAFIVSNDFSQIPENGFDYPFPLLLGLPFPPVFRLYGRVGTKKTDNYLNYSAWNPTYNRLNQPLRPHNTQIDAEARSSDPFPMMRQSAHTVTWSTRSRATIGVSLQSDVAEASEVDISGDRQFHRVLLVDSALVTHNLGATLSDADYNTLAVEIPNTAALGVGRLYVRAETTVGQSRYHDYLPVNILPATFYTNEAGTEYYINENDAPNELVYVTEGS